LKKKRYDDMDESSVGLPPKDSPRRGHDRRDRSRERRYRDPRDEFDDPPRFRRERDRAHDKRLPIDDTPLNEEEPDKSSIKMSPPPIKRPSPTYEAQEDYNPDEPKEDDSEARSVFVSQLAARLTARDLGYFFEDKLGEGTVMDSRIVTDRLSRRSTYWIRRVPSDRLGRESYVIERNSRNGSPYHGSID
jgi:RNA-binding protein 39